MKPRKGMTLLELLFVLTVLVMLAAISYPAIDSMYGQLRVQAGADHLCGRLAEARSRAILENRPYRFAVKADTGNYRVAPDSPDQWGETAQAGQNGQLQSQQDDSAPAPLVDEGTLPHDIIFQFGAGADTDSSGGLARGRTFHAERR